MRNIFGITSVMSSVLVSFFVFVVTEIAKNKIYIVLLPEYILLHYEKTQII